MKMTVRFITLSDAQTEEINAHGWDCPIGRAYMEATCKGNPVSALALGMYVDAASGDFKNVDHVWQTIQNGVHKYDRWIMVPGVMCLTDRPRSMMTGDIVVSEFGDIWLCISNGWRNLAEI